MTKVDRFIVPGAFVIALLIVLSMTVSWIRHPVDPLYVQVTMGPPARIIVPGRTYGLRFTPRNGFTGKTVPLLIAGKRPCVNVTVTNSRLTYLGQSRACRLRDGSYEVPYAFPQDDDYVIFVEMHPARSIAQVYRFTLQLDRCTLQRRALGYHPSGHGPGGSDRSCPAPPALLRGRETARVYTRPRLTVVLGAPAHALQAGHPVQITFVFLHRGRTVRTVKPAVGMAGDAIAISMDTMHLVRLPLDPGQDQEGYASSGAASYTGQFDTPSIYRVFATFLYRQHPIHVSFVVDVNPAPPPTPVSD